LPGVLTRYANWLHLRWPAGEVEPLPRVGAGGATAVPGLYICGDLTGIPLLKFALDTGARSARAIAADLARRPAPAGMLPLVIVGAGVSGLAAGAEAQRVGLRFELLEAARPLTTLIHFPKGKPIYTYPRAMEPAGKLRVSADVKEALVEELESQRQELGLVPRIARVERIERRAGGFELELAGGGTLKAARVLIAIGRSGDFRRLGVPGETLDKVYDRLHDPADFAGRDALVVGGGDSALETAIALAEAGAAVTLAHRGESFARPKPANLARLDAVRAPDAAPGRVAVRLGTRVREIREDDVLLDPGAGPDAVLPNDVVFTMIGREAPLDFLRRAGIPITGDHSTAGRLALVAFLLFCAWLEDWKSGGWFSSLWYARHWFPTDLPARLAAAGGAVAAAARDPHTLIGTLAISAASPSFYYTLAYSVVVTVFGAKRIRRRRTPYVTAQTLTLMAIQVVPLFLLPEIVLPLLDARGLLPRALADALFPVVSYGHGREFWRAYGLILAWPLDVYNVFTQRPLWAWIGIGFVQTCVLIPLAVYFFGKGAYCGWICSCGALAETLGDTQRHKMPHGGRWNRLNLAGQAVLGIALVLLAIRIAGWVLPAGNPVAGVFDQLLRPAWQWGIDVTLAGVIGYGLYFWWSGRFWCRFFCPLAALMHVYARFSRFAIVAEKSKCISCNACTSVCHQGIAVMAFANKGEPMRDPECVRCSACVAECPTGVLRFGQVTPAGTILSVDALLASPVRAREAE